MPVTLKQRKDYQKKLGQLYKEVDTTTEGGLKTALNFLKQMGRKVTAEMAVAKNYRAEHLKALRKELKSHVSEFEERLLDVTGKAQKKTYRLGAKSATTLPKVFGVKIDLPGVDETALRVAQSFTADLVTGVTDKMRSRINREVSQVALGIKKPDEAIADLGKIITPVRTRVGLVGSAYRAEMVMRTETNRAFSIGANERAKQVETKSPGLKKWWLTAADERVRPTHVDAGVRYDETNAIPIKQNFHVGRGRLKMPSDPAGPPEEVINCRCRAIYTHPDWEEAAAAKVDKKVEKMPPSVVAKQAQAIGQELGRLSPSDLATLSVPEGLEVLKKLRKEVPSLKVSEATRKRAQELLRIWTVGESRDEVSELKKQMVKSALEGGGKDLDALALIYAQTQAAHRGRKQPFRLSRGVALTDEDFGKLEVGSKIDTREVGSWTRSTPKAEDFAEVNVILDEKNKVVFLTDVDKADVFADHSSNKAFDAHKDEQEFLVIGPKRREVEAMVKVGDVTFVTLKKVKTLTEAAAILFLDFSSPQRIIPKDLESAIALWSLLKKRGELATNKGLRRVLKHQISMLTKKEFQEEV